MLLLILVFIGSNSEWSLPLEDHGIHHDENYVAVDDLGNILCTNYDERQLLLFDSEGRLRKKTGHRGEGPGAFSRLNGVSWVSELNGFMVHDVGNSRLSLYSSDLELKQTMPLKEFINRDVSIDARHIYVLRDNNGHKGEQPFLLQLNTQGGTKRELFKLPALEKQSGVHVDDGTYYIFRIFPWDHQLLFALGDGFFVTCFNEKPQFTIHNLETGKTIKSVRVGLGGVLLTQDHMEQQLAAFEPDYKRAVMANLNPPKSWPVIVNIQVVGDRIWVFGPPGTDGHAYQQYDVNGNLKQTGVVASIPKVISGANYYTLKTGVNDVVLLGKHRIK